MSREGCTVCVESQRVHCQFIKSVKAVGGRSYRAEHQFLPLQMIVFFLTFSFQVSKSNDNIFFLTLFLDINYILTKLNDSVLDLNVTLVS